MDGVIHCCCCCLLFAAISIMQVSPSILSALFPHGSPLTGFTVSVFLALNDASVGDTKESVAKNEQKISLQLYLFQFIFSSNI